jgi:hypothetical protein
MISIVLGLLIVGWLATVMIATQARSNNAQVKPAQVRKQPVKAARPTAVASSPRFDEQVPAFSLK